MEYMFGVRRGKIDRKIVRKIERIAKKHGVTFVYADIPGNGTQAWFAGPNYGSPFDAALARSVFADLEKAGIDYDNIEGKAGA